METLPTIHINGTNKYDLMGDLLQFHRATCQAHEIGKNSRPHPRDYPNGKYKTASQEYEILLTKLVDVASELWTYIEKIELVNS